jgi:very-short-patch-repair endonuclease/predicted N-acetyltransferase YhbS
MRNDEDLVVSQKQPLEMKTLARKLRREMTPAEARLWDKLRMNRLQGLHFRRQQVIDGFIADFYCHETRLIIEVDGEIHAGQEEYDRERDAIIATRNLRILRFVNARVIGDMDSVLSEIVAAARAVSPLPGGEGGQGGEVKIRPANLSDANRVFELLQQFATSYKPEHNKFEEIFPELITSPAACLLVAEDAGVVVGYALALRVPVLYANGPLWMMQELMVDPNRRSEGIGRQLLQAVIAHARNENAMEVVVVSRRAGGYYVKHGFTESASYYKLKLI